MNDEKYLKAKKLVPKVQVSKVQVSKVQVSKVQVSKVQVSKVQVLKDSKFQHGSRGEDADRLALGYLSSAIFIARVADRLLFVSTSTAKATVLLSLLLLEGNSSNLESCLI